MKMVYSRKIVFHIRTWEVGLYTALEDYFLKNTDMELEFHYITHHFQAEHLLKKKGRKCLNINRELKKIPFPSDWWKRLQDLENRYIGYTKNFQQYLIAERFMRSKPRVYQMRQLYRTAMFFDSYFAKHKPFFMLSNGPDHMAFWLAMDMLRYHGGHPCGLVPPSLPRYHFSMYRQVGRIYYGKELYKEYLKKGLSDEEHETVTELQNAFLKGKAVPVNISHDRIALIRRRSFKTRVKSHLNSTYWQYMENIKGSWYVTPLRIPGTYFLDKALVKLRVFIRNFFFNEVLSSDVPFVFFPLHVEPEATTTIYSNFYENQLETIRSVSKALPVSWALVVKEHPNNKNGRCLNFYSSLKKLPNIVLIKTDTPSWILIRSCRMVATLSGTAGFEASIVGKPVLLFGDPGWGYSPSVKKVETLHNLSKTISELDRAQLSQDDDRVQAYVLSWIQANPEGLHSYFSWYPPIDDPKNVALIGKGLVKLLHDLNKDKFSDA